MNDSVSLSFFYFVPLEDLFKNKKILIGITGSIAAYKSILLVRLLVKAGAEVKVILTPAAKSFVSPLVLSTLSRNEVLVDMYNENTWSNHVMLGRWADVMVIAPLSCNTLSKMAAGQCDNLLLAVYLSATCPVAVFPAMDEDMWHHTSTKRNIDLLRQYGNKVIDAETGELASGLYGEGRMTEPENIMQYLAENYFREDILKDKKALITAGPTYEALDPVRFLGNHSTGKMGFALAEAMYEKGANVWLITGPTNCKTSYKGINIINVVSSKEMCYAAKNLFGQSEITIMSAAVADYRPETISKEKVKKNSDKITIDLERTDDILKSLGAIKSEEQFLVGFALETSNEKEYALQKLRAKNADMIVLNSLKDDNAGFAYDTNKVTIFDADGSEHLLELASKKNIAEQIVDVIIKKLYA